MDKQHQNMVRIQITDCTRKAGDKQHQDVDKIQPNIMQNEGGEKTGWKHITAYLHCKDDNG